MDEATQTIQLRLDYLMDKIEQEKASTGSSQTAFDLQTAGVNAILGGTGQWCDFMKLVAAGNASHLARLIPSDGSQVDENKQKARAYLIANATCGTGTYKKLKQTVSGILDY